MISSHSLIFVLLCSSLLSLINPVSQIDDRLTAYTLQQACSSGESSILSALAFQTAVTNTYLSNAAVDLFLALSAPHHFNDETFAEGRAVVAQGAAAVKAAVKQGSFISARISLGAACHTLQVNACVHNKCVCS